MFSSLFVAVLLLASASSSFVEQLDLARQETKFNGKIWVVLVAGSNGYYNYRHQADVYHAYQVMKEHGVPSDNIIVFHYDDIANSDENPTKGVVINKPNGKDVYHGVPKDYIGDDVNPDNFINCIEGSAALAKKGKKVLKSGPNDHVFIYFTDHGAPGLIAFPNDYLYATRLNTALKTLHSKKMYQKLVFYVEACESGSMFDGLLSNKLNIYATTAANANESSYACYWDDKRQTYLGDVYSVKWIENSDKKKLGSETLEQQFKTVKKETNTSHVEEFGDLTIAKLPLTQFQGAKSGSSFDATPAKVGATVDSGDVPLDAAFKRFKAATTTDEKNRLYQVYQTMKSSRNYLDNQMDWIAQHLSTLFPEGSVNAQRDLIQPKRKLEHHECHKRLVDSFHSRCFNVNKHTYALRKIYVFANFCELVSQIYRNGSEEVIGKAVEKMQNHCDAFNTSGFKNRIL